MKNTEKEKAGQSAEALKGLRNIDTLFEELEQDISLPSFGEFFMTSLVMGNAECVNLKLLYPALYARLSTWLKQHNKEIVTKRN